MRYWIPLVLVVCLVSVQTGCTGLVRDEGVYASKAGRAAAVVASAVQTARYAVQAAEAGAAPGRYVVQLLVEAEDEAGSARSTFEAIQSPGPAADALAEELGALLDEATTTLTRLRVHARRGDTGRLVADAEPLPKLAELLGGFAEAHA
jgi:hypothetical protein